MAGGQGTRLWPVSRKSKPKQVIKLLNEQTLVEATHERLRQKFLPKQIYVATIKEYAKVLHKLLPDIPKSQYSIEPVLRDRGPAVGLGALMIHHADPESVFVMAWSDHHIKNVKAYFESLKKAEEFLKHRPQTIIAIGAKPTSPHTGFRYIHLGKAQTDADSDFFQVKEFKDKPNHRQAKKFVSSGKFLWNTGYFVATSAYFLEFYREFLPEVYEVLMKIRPYLGTKKQQWAIDRFYPKMPKTDFEYVLLKHPEKLTALTASFDWIDVGSWRVIKDVLSKSKQNLVKGLALLHKAEDNLIYNYEKKLVAVTGLKNVIVVNTPDALLIAPKDQSESVKELIKKIQNHPHLKKYL